MSKHPKYHQRKELTSISTKSDIALLRSSKRDISVWHYRSYACTVNETVYSKKVSEDAPPPLQPPLPNPKVLEFHPSGSQTSEYAALPVSGFVVMFNCSLQNAGKLEVVMV